MVLRKDMRKALIYEVFFTKRSFPTTIESIMDSHNRYSGYATNLNWVNTIISMASSIKEKNAIASGMKSFLFKLFTINNLVVGYTKRKVRAKSQCKTLETGHPSSPVSGNRPIPSSAKEDSAW